MARIKSKYVCQQCGYESAGYLGKCPECGSWSCFVEEITNPTIAKKSTLILDDTPPMRVNEIVTNMETRFPTAISEFDRVLGGGIVQGSVILIAGDPGIGKSTLLLQTSGTLTASGKKILYTSAEESLSQIKLRAERLNVTSDKLFIYSQTSLESIKAQIETLKPDLVIIDSIQAIYSQEVQSSAGSVSQIRECCNALINLAKRNNIAIIVIGHVTKEGNIAGPKVLEHMVDAVIQFEGDKYKSHRILRSMKNRFGNTSEVGIFEMEETGLREILNPSELFIKDLEATQAPGSVTIVTNEGSRPLLVEIQALVGTTPYPTPRRVANGVDTGRVHQILAVLEKRVGLNLSKQDVYVNVIGGMDITEPAADLGIAMAITTCARDIVLSQTTAIVGEIGLSGEIRAVSNIEKRIIEAQKLGFKKILIPQMNNLSKEIQGIQIIKVKNILDAFHQGLSKE